MRADVRDYVLAGLGLLLVVVAACAFGTEPVSLWTAWHEPASIDRAIAVGLRLPRISLAILAGAALSASGAALQAMLRNPLAEPFVLGVSGGAALGATLALALGLPALGLLGAGLVPLAATVGGILATVLVLSIVSRSASSGQSGGASLLLAGVVVNALASAVITFLKTLVPAERGRSMLFWLTGYLEARPVRELALLAVYIGIALAILIKDAPALNLLALGHDGAESLGIDVRTLERRVLLASSLLVGAVVSSTGLIGFVGLVVPHILRRFYGPDTRRLLPLSAIWGAFALVLCDLGARLLFHSVGTEPPVGALTALIGGPLFLYVLRSRTRTS